MFFPLLGNLKRTKHVQFLLGLNTVTGICQQPRQLKSRIRHLRLKPLRRTQFLDCLFRFSQPCQYKPEIISDVSFPWTLLIVPARGRVVCAPPSNE